MVYLLAIAALGLVALLLTNRKPKAPEERPNRPPSDSFKHDVVPPVSAAKAAELSLPKQEVPTEDTSNESVKEGDTQEPPKERIVKTKNEAAKLRQRGDHKGAYKASKFLPPIKKGYQIFLKNMGITGLGYRREDAVAFIDDMNQALRLEREPDNSQDENAIKVIGLGDSGEYFLGYLPRFAALQIVKTDSFNAVYGRLVRAYRGTDDYIEIQLQIVGLKEKKQEFDAFAKGLPAQGHQKEYLTYWNIPFDESLTVGEAESIVHNHSEETRKDTKAWSEFQDYLKIIEDFEDDDNQESYGLAEVPRDVLIKTLRELRMELGSYEAISDEPDVLVERILEKHPELAIS